MELEQTVFVCKLTADRLCSFFHRRCINGKELSIIQDGPFLVAMEVYFQMLHTRGMLVFHFQGIELLTVPSWLRSSKSMIVSSWLRIFSRVLYLRPWNARAPFHPFKRSLRAISSTRCSERFQFMNLHWVLSTKPESGSKKEEFNFLGGKKGKSFCSFLLEKRT